MKTLLSLGVSSMMVCFSMSVAHASNDIQKQVRNDRVTVSKNIHQFEINPFADSKRVIRNDRVSYSNPKVAVVSDTAQDEKVRIMRNDRVSVTVSK